MRRLWLYLFGFLGLIINVLPASAQGGSIAQIVNRRTDLSTLAAFLDAAPEVRDQLDSSGSYTLFAPNDQAFANLISTLDVSLADLLGSPEIAAAMVRYHTIDGALSAQQIRQRDGQVVLTLLPGAFVSFRVDDDGTLAVNNVVEIIESDIRASNGTIHIINDVLLNRVIDQLVDDIDLETLITPNSTSVSAVSREEPTPEESAAPIEVANIRFAHLATETPPVQVHLDEQPFFDEVGFGEMSDFQPILPGSYTLNIDASQDDSDRALHYSIALQVENGDFLSLVLIGSFESDSLNAVVVEEDYSAIEAGQSRVLVANAVEDAPELDFAFNETVLVEGLSFGQSRTLDLASDDYDLAVYTFGDPDNPITEESGLEFDENTYNFLAITGSSNDPSLLLSSLDADTVEELRQASPLERVEATQSAEAAPDQTVLDILTDDDNFSIFIEALDLADDSVINRLASRNEGPITVLAPSNQAFENLFATFGSQSRLFANRRLLTQVLQYHLINGELLASDFRAAGGTSIITLLPPTQAFFVSVNSDGEVFLNGRVQFEEVDILAANGVIQVIDDVLLPQAALDAWN